MHEVFDHTADIGLRVRAPTFEQLLVDAAEGFFGLIVSNLDQVDLRQELQISVPARGSQHDYLLFDWLNELLYVFDTRRLVLAKFEVRCPDQGNTAQGIQATAWGEPLDASRHQLDHEVKAITYHGLKVEREGDAWLAEVILDI